MVLPVAGSKGDYGMYRRSQGSRADEDLYANELRNFSKQSILPEGYRRVRKTPSYVALILESPAT